MERPRNRIWTVGGDKGGVGKSTTAAMLAAWLAPRGGVTLIDTDLHSDATGWLATRLRQHPQLPLVHGRHVLEGIGDIACEEAAESGRHVVIDVGGRDAELLRVAMSVAHVLIMPVCPSHLDLFSCKRMAKRVAEVRRWNPQLRALFFVNRADPNWALRGAIDEAHEVCRTFAPLVETVSAVWHRRIAFVRAMGDGRGVHEQPGGDQAAEELAKLMAEIDPALEESTHGTQGKLQDRSA